MPHIRLEYSNNLNITFKLHDLFREIHHILHEVAGIEISNCKSRVIRSSDFFIGEGDDQEALVHLDIHFLEGRSNDIKKDTGNRLLSLLKKYFKEEDNSCRIQITIEIHDIIRETYFKYSVDSRKT